MMQVTGEMNPGNHSSSKGQGSVGLCIRLVLFLLLVACAPKELLYYASPVLVPGTAREMNTPGFWIGAHPAPDDVIMSSEEIILLNERIRQESGVVRDIHQYPQTTSGITLQEGLSRGLDALSQRTLFTREHRRVGRDFLDPLRSLMNLENIPHEIIVRYALVVTFTDQRILPTDQGLYSARGRFDFDRLQNSALDVGTPVAVLHESRDGQWLYGVAPLSEGWIRSDHAAECSLEQLEYYTRAEPFAVSVRAKTDIYLDPGLRKHYGSLRMGVRMPHNGCITRGVFEVLLPRRRDDGRITFSGGYISADKISDGYLPYTPRTMIEQAFWMLNAPYGWGGMYGERDCSRYLQEVFATCGIQIPRNSAQQARVGTLIASFTPDESPAQRREKLLSSPGGITILSMPGHVMLLLGFHNGDPYAIHALWAYSEAAGTSDRVRVVNRTAVTSLSLGESSGRKSLLERLTTVRSLDRGSFLK